MRCGEDNISGLHFVKVLACYENDIVVAGNGLHIIVCNSVSADTKERAVRVLAVANGAGHNADDSNEEEDDQEENDKAAENAMALLRFLAWSWFGCRHILKVKRIQLLTLYGRFCFFCLRLRLFCWNLCREVIDLILELRDFLAVLLVLPLQFRDILTEDTGILDFFQPFGKGDTVGIELLVLLGYFLKLLLYSAKIGVDLF